MNKSIKLKVGTNEIVNCVECPAYTWTGENISQGDLGFRCEFGAYKRYYGNMADNPIPDNCPLMIFKI